MEEVLGSAKLADEIPAERALATTISREAIRSALDDEDAPAPLMLDVVRRSEEGSADRSTISIAWSPRDLEALLERAVDDKVTLTFDRAELEQALADVEAHGLRERALVFTVAATAAFSTATAAAHAVPLVGSTGEAAAPAASYTDVSSAGGYAAPAAATSADAVVTDASSAGGYAAAETASADRMVTDASSSGGYAAAETAGADRMVTDASSAAGYAAAETAGADRMVTDASSAGGYAAAETASADQMVTDASSAAGYAAAETASADQMVTDASSSAGYAAAETAGADRTMTDVSSGGGYPAPATEDSASGATFDLSAPSALEAALAGGAALAIAGAAFAARRTKPARPA